MTNPTPSLAGTAETMTAPCIACGHETARHHSGGCGVVHDGGTYCGCLVPREDLIAATLATTLRENDDLHGWQLSMRLALTDDIGSDDDLLALARQMRLALAERTAECEALRRESIEMGGYADQCNRRAEAACVERDEARDIIDCGTNALRDSILASGNDSRTNLHWVNKMRRDAGLDAARPHATPEGKDNG